MPIVKVPGKLVHFCHVPRCDRSAIKDYLRARFGPLGFLNRSFYKLSERRRCNVSSPQNVETAAMYTLIPPAFFTAWFAVIRHPVDRIVSVFRYQRYVEQRLPADTAFGAWLEEIPGNMAADPHYLDNHTRPVTEIVCKAARVLRLENRMAPVVDCLDKQAGDKREPRAISMANSYKQHLEAASRPITDDFVVPATTRAIIGQIYAADLDRFGYNLALR